MASRSFFRPDKSAAQVKPQPPNRYSHPDTQDEMDVDDLLTPKPSNSATQPGNINFAQPPVSPSPQPSQPPLTATAGGATRPPSALPPGLSFTKTTTTGAKRDRDTADTNDSPNKRTATSTTDRAAVAGGSGTSHSTPTGETAPNAQMEVTAEVGIAPAGEDPIPPIGGDPAPPIGGAGDNNDGKTIYHQIGRPDLTGPTPIPPLPILVPPGPILTPATFSPPSKFQLVPRPDGGFPQVKGHTYETIRAHVNPATLNLWNDHAGPAVIAFSPSDRGEIDTPKVITFRDMLRNCLRNPDIFIQVPDLNRNVYTEHKPVTPYLIGGLTTEQRDILLFWTCWATPKSVFFIFPNTPFVTDYIMTLEKTYLDNNASAIAKVHIAIEEVILTNNDNEFEGFLENYLNLPDITIEAILNNVVTSLLVVPLDITEKGANVTLFNIYAPSPTLIGDIHTGWLDLFRNRTYTFYGTANAMTPYTCGTCSGQDHPSGKCPFHDIPGWHKPEPTSKYGKPINMNPQSPGQQRGQGESTRGAWNSNNRGRGGRGAPRGGQRGWSRGNARGRGGRY